MKLIAFGASNSSKSINKALSTYAASLCEGADIEILDLNDFEAPLFSVDLENEIGKSEPAQRFLDKIGEADGLIISFAEHNGLYTAAYKNLFDWCTRIQREVYQNKPVLVLGTSPGGRGAKTVLELATSSLPRFGANIVAKLSVPNFNDNFDYENLQLTNQNVKNELELCLLYTSDAADD